MRFNPRAREGRDQICALRPSRASCFNPRAREGRDPARSTFRRAITSFNPRAREGRDAPHASARPRRPVSIHAPARGATQIAAYAPDLILFQSTRPRGARHIGHAERDDLQRRFNPRAREGRDAAAYTCCCVTATFQSTRPRGARLGINTGRSTIVLFQSTRPRGARPNTVAAATTPEGFQSTRPRGARRNSRPYALILYLFQSTRPRGARPTAAGNASRTHGVSIHAPARGATARVRRRRKMTLSVFQSTRPRGARRRARVRV